MYIECMKRKNIYITDQQSENLERLHKETGTKVSESIRRAIDEYLEKMEKKIKKK